MAPPLRGSRPGHVEDRRDQVKKLETEQKTLSAKVEELMGEWERIETELGELGA